MRIYQGSNNLFSVKNKVIVITGGAGFLGSEYAAFLARAGARVVILDVLASSVLERHVNRISRSVSRKILGLCVDITKKKEVSQAVKTILKRYGKIDVLINNAALTFSPSRTSTMDQFSPYESYPAELWEQALSIGCTGTFLMTQAVIPVMKKQRSGVVIMIGSIYGIVAPDNRIYQAGKFGSLAYATSKGALPSFTRAIASYGAPFGIRANLLTLGGTLNKQDPQFVKKYSARTMLGRMAERDDYNGALLFLLSDASRYMTGATIP